MSTDFLKQTDQPLYPKALWNRPISRSGAGRLLVLGGHSQEFSVPQAVFQAAQAAGIGECRVILPDSLIKVVGQLADLATFVPSSPGGSFGRGALGPILELARDYDGLIIAGSMSKNSETAILLEGILERLDQPLILGEEIWPMLKHRPEVILSHPKRLIIGTTGGLFRLAGQLKVPVRLRPEAGLLNLIDLIEGLAERGSADWLMISSDLIVNAEGKTLVTPGLASFDSSLVLGVAATFWLQNLAKPLEGLATASYILRQSQKGSPRNIQDQIKAVGQAISQLD